MSRRESVSSTANNRRNPPRGRRRSSVLSSASDIVESDGSDIVERIHREAQEEYQRRMTALNKLGRKNLDKEIMPPPGPKRHRKNTDGGGDTSNPNNLDSNRSDQDSDLAFDVNQLGEDVVLPRAKDRYTLKDAVKVIKRKDIPELNQAQARKKKPALRKRMSSIGNRNEATENAETREESSQPLMTSTPSRAHATTDIVNITPVTANTSQMNHHKNLLLTEKAPRTQRGSKNVEADSPDEEIFQTSVDTENDHASPLKKSHGVQKNRESRRLTARRNEGTESQEILALEKPATNIPVNSTPVTANATISQMNHHKTPLQTKKAPQTQRGSKILEDDSSEEEVFPAPVENRNDFPSRLKKSHDVQKKRESRGLTAKRNEGTENVEILALEERASNVPVNSTPVTTNANTSQMNSQKNLIQTEKAPPRTQRGSKSVEDDCSEEEVLPAQVDSPLKKSHDVQKNRESRRLTTRRNEGTENQEIMDVEEPATNVPVNNAPVTSNATTSQMNPHEKVLQTEKAPQTQRGSKKVDDDSSEEEVFPVENRKDYRSRLKKSHGVQKKRESRRLIKKRNEATVNQEILAPEEPAASVPLNSTPVIVNANTSSEEEVFPAPEENQNDNASHSKKSHGVQKEQEAGGSTSKRNEGIGTENEEILTPEESSQPSAMTNPMSRQSVTTDVVRISPVVASTSQTNHRENLLTEEAPQTQRGSTNVGDSSEEEILSAPVENRNVRASQSHLMKSNHLVHKQRESQSSQRPRQTRRQSLFQKAKGASKARPKKAPAKKEETSNPYRYTGDDVFGNYHLLEEDQVKAILGKAKRKNVLSEDEIPLFALRINHYIEDFLNHLCNTTAHPYGFFTFDKLFNELKNNQVLPDTMNAKEFYELMKQSLSETDFQRSAGILFPNSESVRPFDTASYLV